MQSNLSIDQIPLPDSVKNLVTLTKEQQEAVQKTQEELKESGVLESRSSAEIEKELLQKEEQEAIKRAENMSPAQISEVFFRTFWPMYQQRISSLSNKGARRVLEAIVQWPLEDEAPKFKSNDEKEAFSLGVRLIDSKTIIRDTVELEMLKKQQENVDKHQQKEYTEEVKEILDSAKTEFVKGDKNGN